MSQQDKVIFRAKRDFGEIVNATFQFVMKQAKPLFVCILYLVVPVSTIGGILFGYSFFRLFSMIDEGNFGGPTFGMGFLMTIGALLLFVGYILNIGVILEYIRSYSKDPDKEILPREVWNNVKGKLFRLFLYLLLVAVMTVAATLVMSLGMGVGFASNNPTITFIMVIAVYLGIIAFIFFILTRFALGYNIIVEEDLGAITALKRSAQLVSGNFWPTLGLILILGLIVSSITSLVTIPIAIIIGIVQLHDVSSANMDDQIMNVYSMIYMFIIPINAIIRPFIYSIYLTGVSLKYYSQVEEKEGVGLLESIRELDEEESDSNGQNPIIS